MTKEQKRVVIAQLRVDKMLEKMGKSPEDVKRSVLLQKFRDAEVKQEIQKMQVQDDPRPIWRQRAETAADAAVPASPTTGISMTQDPAPRGEFALPTNRQGWAGRSGHLAPPTSPHEPNPWVQSGPRGYASLAKTRDRAKDETGTPDA